MTILVIKFVVCLVLCFAFGNQAADSTGACDTKCANDCGYELDSGNCKCIPCGKGDQSEWDYPNYPNEPTSGNGGSGGSGDSGTAGGTGGNGGSGSTGGNGGSGSAGGTGGSVSIGVNGGSGSSGGSKKVETIDQCPDKCYKQKNCRGYGHNEEAGCTCQDCHPVLGEELTPEQKQQFVDVHNELRSKVALGQTNQPAAADMTKLVWDEDLAKKAKDWARRCIAGHPNEGDYGQNWASHISIPQTVKAWYDEISMFTFQTRSCTGKCGHYTQVAWAKSTKVGCATHRCMNRAVQNYAIVCNYYPPGNYVGQFPYQTGAACSKCPKGKTTCTKGLCS